MQVRRISALCAALLLVLASVPASAQRNNNNQRSQQPAQRPVNEQQDIEALVRTVDAVAAGQPAPSDIAITWNSNHFVKGQGGDTYIPFDVTIDRSQLSQPGVAFYVRIVDKNAPPPAAPAAPAEGQKPAPPVPVRYAWDNIHFIDVPQDGRLSRAVQLKPGEYTAYIAVKERTPAPAGNQRNNDRNRNQQTAAAAAPAPKMGLLRRDLSVPDYNAPELRTSSVIVARAVEPMTTALSPTEQEANPYVFGPMRIVPSPDGKYAKSAELNVIFWIYGAQAAADGKPDVTVEYAFHRKEGEAEKYFNRTAPQELNSKTLPPEFSVAAGHQLPGSLVVPLTSFPAGDYRLEIKITDKPSGKVVTQNVTFSVLPV